MTKTKKDKSRDNKFPPLPKLVKAEQKQARFKCGHCGKTQVVNWDELDISSGGGCDGHGYEEYCYCSSPYVEIQIGCSACKVLNEIRGQFSYP